MDPAGLLLPGRQTTMRCVWSEPYLETCCRSALHRLVLSGTIGRPAGLKDGPCLARLASAGLAKQQEDGRYAITDAGALRHASEVLKQPPSHADALRPAEQWRFRRRRRVPL